MGYKDDKWIEAPGYCVECDRLKPLSCSAVCEECWNTHPVSSYTDWEESESLSRWFYERMKGFIIICDYKEEFCTSDVLRIIDYIYAESPKHAILVWRDRIDDETVIEKLVNFIEVIDVEGDCILFEIHSWGFSFSQR